MKTLERSLSQVISDMEEAKKQWDAEHTKEMQENRIETNGMRQVVKLKTKELNKIKKLSQIILDQRTQVEQFLLEAIEQVKSELTAKRKDEYKAQHAEYQKQLKEGTNKIKLILPELGRSAKGALGPGLNAPIAPPLPEIVTWKDLSLEDRERVLRLLFARMNSNVLAASQKQQNMKFQAEVEIEPHDVTPPEFAAPPVADAPDSRSTLFLTQNPFEYPDFKLPSSSHSSRINQPTSSIKLDASMDHLLNF